TSASPGRKRSAIASGTSTRRSPPKIRRVPLGKEPSRSTLGMAWIVRGADRLVKADRAGLAPKTPIALAWRAARSIATMAISRMDRSAHCRVLLVVASWLSTGTLQAQAPNDASQRAAPLFDEGVVRFQNAQYVAAAQAFL